VQLDLAYARPTQRTKVSNYVFDAFGPYPLVGAGLVAGINQLSNAPPEWYQGAEGCAKRFGSDFGIAAVSTTTRYALMAKSLTGRCYRLASDRGVSIQHLELHARRTTLEARRQPAASRSLWQ
jgi:hypothetical protein